MTFERVRVAVSYSKPSGLTEASGLFSGISDGFVHFLDVRFDDGSEAAALAVPIANVVDVRQNYPAESERDS